MLDKDYSESVFESEEDIDNYIAQNSNVTNTIIDILFIFKEFYN